MPDPGWKVKYWTMLGGMVFTVSRGDKNHGIFFFFGRHDHWYRSEN